MPERQREKSYSPLREYISGFNPEKVLHVEDKVEARGIDVMLAALREDTKLVRQFEERNLHVGDKSRLSDENRHKPDHGKDVLSGVQTMETFLLSVCLNADESSHNLRLISEWGQRIDKLSYDVHEPEARSRIQEFVRNEQAFDFNRTFGTVANEQIHNQAPLLSTRPIK